MMCALALLRRFAESPFDAGDCESLGASSQFSPQAVVTMVPLCVTVALLSWTPLQTLIHEGAGAQACGL